MPPAEAAALLILPSLRRPNVDAIGGAGAAAAAARLWPMLAGDCVPGPLAGSFAIGGAAALPALGLALLAYAAWGLATPPLTLPPRGERRSAVPGRHRPAAS